ncbi:MAG: sulfur oxidation c-type cytochrome SoxX [Beijerinckiaceae bacterium]
MNKNYILAGVFAATAGAALAQDKAPERKVDQAVVDKVVASSWRNLTPELQKRVDQDETMKICSETRNNPAQAQADKIVAIAKASVKYPEDGNFMGDWRRGEKSALDGWGGRMGDNTPGRPNGGNCYACHQMAPAEIAYGTLGPSLMGYGKARAGDKNAPKEVYEKIYNPHVVLACSAMPRFGVNNFLTIEQIKDAVAFLLSPESPVNK